MRSIIRKSIIGIICVAIICLTTLVPLYKINRQDYCCDTCSTERLCSACAYNLSIEQVIKSLAGAKGSIELKLIYIYGYLISLGCCIVLIQTKTPVNLKDRMDN